MALVPRLQMKKGAAVGDSDDSDIDDEDDSDDEAGGGMLLSDILTANLRDEAASKVSAGTRRRPCAALLLLTHVASRLRSGECLPGKCRSPIASRCSCVAWSVQQWRQRRRLERV